MFINDLSQVVKFLCLVYADDDEGDNHKTGQQKTTARRSELPGSLAGEMAVTVGLLKCAHMQMAPKGHTAHADTPFEVLFCGKPVMDATWGQWGPGCEDSWPN